MSSFGRADSPIAMSARWRMPPEYSCGNWSMRRLASGSPASSSSSMARAWAFDPEAMPLARSDSLIWWPTFHTGLRFDIGSCGTRPISAPRRAVIRRLDAWVMSSPSKVIVPPVTWPPPGSSPMIECASVDLPEPDSPTMATVSPGKMSRSTPNTVGAGFFLPPKAMSTPRMDSRGTSAPARAEASRAGLSCAGVSVTSSSPSGRARP